MWFDPVDTTHGPPADVVEERDDGWGGLSGIAGEGDHEGRSRHIVDWPHVSFMVGDPDQLVPEDALPFKRLRLAPDEEEEEDIDSVRKGVCLSKL